MAPAAPAAFGIALPSAGVPPVVRTSDFRQLQYGSWPRLNSSPVRRVRRVRRVLRRAEADDRLVLVAVGAILWNVLVITLALLAEIGDTERRERGASFRLKKKTWGLQSLQQADGPIPRLIPSLEELGWLGEKETSSTWSPSKDDLDEGILRSEGFQSSFAVSELTNPPKAASNSKDLSMDVVFGSFFPRQAQVTWSLLQRFLSNEEERRFARKAVLFLATVSADAQEEKFWKHKAALLLTLARLGADRGTLLAALLDGDNDAARQDALTPLLMGNSLGIEVGHLLDERQAISDLVALFDLRAVHKEAVTGSLDTWPASAQLCRQLFVQSCRDTRPVLLELTGRALRLAELHSPEDAMAQALARSTLEFHAPIARSLGYDLLDSNSEVGLLPLAHCETLPNTLEHFGLLLRYPTEYRLVLEWFDGQFGFLDRILAHGTRVVKAALKGDPAFQSLASSYQVKSRIKSPQSLMKKLLQGRVVNDLLGLEIIIKPRHMISGKGELSAYAAAAGILRYVSSVENGWRVAPKSFKDYVSEPKKSGYQAIHLTLVTDFQALALSAAGPRAPRAPCQLELHIFTEMMKSQERRGPASHASYKAFPLRPETILEKLGGETGVVSITEVAHHDFVPGPVDATQKLEELAHRAGFEDMDLEALRISRSHVDEVVSAFQELMASSLTALPEGAEDVDNDLAQEKESGALCQCQPSVFVVEKKCQNNFYPLVN